MPRLDINYKMNARPRWKQDLAWRTRKETKFEMKWNGGKSHDTSTASAHSQPFWSSSSENSCITDKEEI